MSDITVRKTQAVTPHIETLANSLHDPIEFVRRHSILCLSTLLQQEYIKWNEFIFYKYLSALLDENREIQHIAKYTLVDMLETKQPGMFTKYFIECIYYMNRFMEDNDHNKFGRYEHECYKPNYSSQQRMTLYRFMLLHMDDHEKFNLQPRLATEIISRIYNRAKATKFECNYGKDIRNPDKIFSAESNQVISDVLQILACPEIQLDILKNLHSDMADTAALEQNVDPDNVPANANAGNANNLANLKLQHGAITYAQKTTAVEKVLPAILGVMKVLEKDKSLPIFKHGIVYLKEFQKNYKKEFEELLKSDMQKKAEYEHMIKKYDRMEERRLRNLQNENNKQNMMAKKSQVLKQSNSQKVTEIVGDGEECESMEDDKENQPLVKRERLSQV